ncbi:cryptochrome/photolyase family protein [Pseudotenacibaculum haliotis]|uniref:Cryptochrome/photolyase family protein n=1 Tax=Pseudotenacibaculum haliotis TaxID=1862138 RepID=A0ABW5LXS7_9FLAO
MNKTTIFWFRRDLRLRDNTGLYHALQQSSNVLPIFIFDTDILEELPKNDARVTLIYDQLASIHQQLRSVSSGIHVYHGKPKEVFEKLISEFKVEAVFTNHDYEPYAIKRDQEIEELLNSRNIDFRTYKDQVIFERNDIVKADGSPYVVYTPYSKKWLETYHAQAFEYFPSESLLENCKSTPYPFPELTDIGFVRSQTPVPEYIVTSNLIQTYEATRNFPSLDKTSKLGPHLRFGTVSIREMVLKAKNEENPTFLKELIWREFFMQILWHFPHTVDKAFKPQYDRIPWRNNTKEFEKWCNGETGFPLVDAGMRQLNQTGFMHNRVRMLVGSFLCKHLLIDWRWGEAYFAKKLIDYEMASNVGNWQWVAGSGVDAAPYFRIFNPITQIQKFDKDLQYIKKWVPDFQELTYPTPMINHKLARERCLATYKQALK